MRRPRDEFAPRRRAGWTVIGTPFGVFGGNRGGYGPRYRRGYGGGRPGGGCARDACLLESGCCLAEGLDGSCLLLALLAVPQLLVSLVHPSAASGRPQDVLLRLIATYRRTVSARRRHPVCRYTPSCSAYAGQAVVRYGALRGSRLAAQRLFRCRPGAPGGVDPVL